MLYALSIIVIAGLIVGLGAILWREVDRHGDAIADAIFGRHGR